jgi:hypothetical protein
MSISVGIGWVWVPENHYKVPLQSDSPQVPETLGFLPFFGWSSPSPAQSAGSPSRPKVPRRRWSCSSPPRFVVLKAESPVAAISATKKHIWRPFLRQTCSRAKPSSPRRSNASADCRWPKRSDWSVRSGRKGRCSPCRAWSSVRLHGKSRRGGADRAGIGAGTPAQARPSNGPRRL